MSKVIYRTENFADLSKYVVSDDVFHDLQVAASDITSNVRYDMRCSLFDYNTRIDSTWEWYYNYLNTQFELSKMFPESYPCNLLDMGYIPLVFIPSTVKSDLAHNMTLYLDLHQIPYTALQASSFNNDRPFYNVKDAWISKFDVIDYYKDLQKQGYAVKVPELTEIKSSELAKLLFNSTTMPLQI